MQKKDEFVKNISLRCDRKVCNMIEELEEELLLNTTGVLKMAIRSLYREEIGNELPNVKGDA